jgi:hypothetical protein
MDTKTEMIINGGPEFKTLIIMAQSIVKMVYRFRSGSLFTGGNEPPELTKRIADFRQLAKQRNLDFEESNDREVYETIRQISLRHIKTT